MKKEMTISVSIIAVLLLAFGFYWFELKTMAARKDCAKIAQDIKYNEMQAAKGKADIRTLDLRMQNEYTFCLHSKGY